MREYSTPATMEPPSSGNLTDDVVTNARDHGAEEVFGRPGPDGWQGVTAATFHDEVRAVAKGLIAAGIEVGDRVALISKTRYEWTLLDYAIWFAGAVTVPVYETSSSEQVQWILEDSGARAVVAETPEHVARVTEVRGALTELNHVWSFTDNGVDILVRLGQDIAEEELESRRTAAGPGDLATLIYTSGTTGRPKGVELTHSCWVFEGEGIESLNFLKPDFRQFLWLPLSHSFGSVLLAGQLKIGFCTAIDGRIERIVPNLAATKPDFVAAVPRIFEKVYNKIVGGAREAGGMKWKIFQWAMAVGLEASRVKQKGQEPGGLLGLKYAIADKLVFSKVRAAFGGNLKAFISGSAPLSRDIAEFFHAAGLLIMEGYGLTESSAASFVNRPDRYKFGTVGLPVTGVQVKLDPADGEILLGGPGIMRGYYKLPEVTAETLTEDGWLRTGDIGEIDAEGFLKITDRKKDLIKTSGGKYVAPTAIEGKFKLINPYVAQAVVHGDRRNFCSMLVAISREEIPKWAESNGLSGLSYEQLIEHPKLKEQVEQSVAQLNAGLASYESIKKWAILPIEPSVENGQLTPSLKLKRKAVEKAYNEVLDGFYKGALA